MTPTSRYEDAHGCRRLVVKSGPVSLYVLGGYVTIPSVLRTLDADQAEHLAACLGEAARRLRRLAP